MREKPALYLSLLEPAEPNDLHMTGIVGDDLPKQMLAIRCSTSASDI